MESHINPGRKFRISIIIGNQGAIKISTTGSGAQSPEKWDYANPMIDHSMKNDEMNKIYDALFFQ